MRRLRILLMMLLVAAVRADVIVLSDGERIEGDVKRTAGGWSITMPDGKVRQVGADEVISIELGARPQDAEQAAQGLASLRRSVQALDDLAQIIQRYQRFIESTRDPATVAEAQNDLDMWRQRQQLGLVRRGERWVTPGESAEIQSKVNAIALQARDLMLQNRSREAEQLVSQALRDDPANPAALYLRGILACQQDKLADARKTLEACNAVYPGHGPTLNNLGVILWRQNQPAGALNYYDQAMQAWPQNSQILANVAEALAGLSEQQRRIAIVARVQRRFAEQDLLLQQQMMQRGLYRWGSMWVDQKKYEELKAAEEQTRQKLQVVQSEIDQIKLRISQIDEIVARNVRRMNEIGPWEYYPYYDGTRRRPSTGPTTTSPSHLEPRYRVWAVPSQLYYDLERENDHLKYEREALSARLTSLQEQARRTEQESSVPRLTGIQRLIGPEGAPGLDSLYPATVPTTSSTP